MMRVIANTCTIIMIVIIMVVVMVMVMLMLMVMGKTKVGSTTNKITPKVIDQSINQI